MATTEELLSGGDRALGRADWAEAKRLFSEALTREEAPQALEGLARASFFLGEGEVALDAHERAYARYRRDGRAVDAARVAIALAWDYRAVRGERAVADGWLARARRLLETGGPTPERGWLALREASFALPGDAALARDRCAKAEALGRELGDVDLERRSRSTASRASARERSPPGWPASTRRRPRRRRARCAIRSRSASRAAT